MERAPGRHVGRLRRIGRIEIDVIRIAQLPEEREFAGIAYRHVVFAKDIAFELGRIVEPVAARIAKAAQLGDRA